jgi:hypothetical protein
MESRGLCRNGRTLQRQPWILRPSVTVSSFATDVFPQSIEAVAPSVSPGGNLLSDMRFIHHLSLPSRDLKRSAAFYDPVMKALGYKRVYTNEWVIGYGLVKN